MLMERVIKPKKGFIGIDFRELYRYRELFIFLAWKDILVRYKQAVIGIGWAVIKPLLTMLIFTFVFGKVARLPSGGVPYPVLAYTGLLPWYLFANALTYSSNSLVGSPQLITKVYFPRMIIPASAIISNLVDFAISFAILLGLMAWYRITPPVTIIYLPLFILLALCASFGAGFWFSALNVQYRDIKYVVPFIVQLGLYVSPVGFDSALIPDKWRLLYSLNPMVSVIDGFRWSILGENFRPDPKAILLSSAVVLFFCITGALYFRRMERTFADVI